MSKKIREMIDKVESFKQFVNENINSQIYYHITPEVNVLSIKNNGIVMGNGDSGKGDVSGELLLKELETKLNTSGSYSIPYHEDSIMTYGKICDHDDGYLCEHRREWILEFFKSNLR
jgi:hypothetical protein